MYPVAQSKGESADSALQQEGQGWLACSFREKPDGQTAYPALAQIAASLPCAVRSGMSDWLKKAENR